MKFIIFCAMAAVACAIPVTIEETSDTMSAGTPTVTVDMQETESNTTGQARTEVKHMMDREKNETAGLPTTSRSSMTETGPEPSSRSDSAQQAEPEPEPYAEPEPGPAAPKTRKETDDEDESDQTPESEGDKKPEDEEDTVVTKTANDDDDDTGEHTEGVAATGMTSENKTSETPTMARSSVDMEEPVAEPAPEPVGEPEPVATVARHGDSVVMSADNATNSSDPIVQGNVDGELDTAASSDVNVVSVDQETMQMVSSMVGDKVNLDSMTVARTEEMMSEDPTASHTVDNATSVVTMSRQDPATSSPFKQHQRDEAVVTFKLGEDTATMRLVIPDDGRGSYSVLNSNGMVRNAYYRVDDSGYFHVLEHSNSVAVDHPTGMRKVTVRFDDMVFELTLSNSTSS